MIVDIDGRQVEIPDGTREFDLEGTTYEVDADTALDARLADLEARLGIHPPQDVAIINQALSDLQQQTGRQLTPDEAQALGELAAQARHPDGTPDTSIMHDALQMRDAVDEYDIAPDDQVAFFQHARDAADADGTPDYQGAHAIINDPGEPEPLTPPPPDATRAQTSEYIAARAAELETDQRTDRALRVAARRDAITVGQDPGTPDADLHDYERAGKDPDTDTITRSQLAEHMAREVMALNAADDAST